MSQYYDVTAGELSVAECDEIALKSAGRISGHSYGYACPKGGTVNDEYDSVVVNTQGMGNHGRIVLRGRTPRARALIREGKVLNLMRQGIPWIVARVAPSCQYGMETDVAQLASDLLETVKVCGPFQGDSHYAFEQWAGSWTGNLEMSFPRKAAAAEVAKAAVWRSGACRVESD